MDLSKTQLIESVFTRGGEMGARMRARLLGHGARPWNNGRNRCEPARALCWAPAILCSSPGVQTPDAVQRCLPAGLGTTQTPGGARA